MALPVLIVTCLTVAVAIVPTPLGRLRPAAQVVPSAPAITVNATQAVHGLLTHKHAHITMSAGSTSLGSFATAQAQGLAAFNLGRMGAQCKCHFHGSCSCDAALEFMDCIAEACHSGACNCDGTLQFMYACHNMSAVCPTASLFCTADSASCYTASDDAASKAANAKEPCDAKNGKPTESPAVASTTQPLPEPYANAEDVGDGPFRKRCEPGVPRPPSLPSSPSEVSVPRVPETEMPDLRPRVPEASLPDIKAPSIPVPDVPNDYKPVMNQRKCFYLLLVLILFCSAFGLAAHSEHGLKVGSAVAATAPFFVLFYMLTTTDLMHRFWTGQPVGWWCALLCFWCAMQFLLGLGVLGAVIAQGLVKKQEEAN